MRQRSDLARDRNGVGVSGPLPCSSLHRHSCRNCLRHIGCLRYIGRVAIALLLVSPVLRFVANTVRTQLKCDAESVDDRASGMATDHAPPCDVRWWHRAFKRGDTECANVASLIPGAGHRTPLEPVRARGILGGGHGVHRPSPSMSMPVAFSSLSNIFFILEPAFPRPQTPSSSAPQEPCDSGWAGPLLSLPSINFRSYGGILLSIAASAMIGPFATWELPIDQRS